MHVAKTFGWSMAHRLGHGYRGKCAHLHGHNYRCAVLISGTLNDQGMVLDFDEITKRCQEWVMRNLDHATMVTEDDESLHRFLTLEHQKQYVLHPPYVNSTAECLAMLLGEVFTSLLHEFPILVQEVHIEETEACWARWQRPTA